MFGTCKIHNNNLEFQHVGFPDASDIFGSHLRLLLNAVMVEQFPLKYGRSCSTAGTTARHSFSVIASFLSLSSRVLEGRRLLYLVGLFAVELTGIDRGYHRRLCPGYIFLLRVKGRVSASLLRFLSSHVQTFSLLFLICGRTLTDPSKVCCLAVPQFAGMLEKTVERCSRGPGNITAPSVLLGLASLKPPFLLFLQLQPHKSYDVAQIVYYLPEEDAVFKLSVATAFCGSFSTCWTCVRCFRTVLERTKMSCKYKSSDVQLTDNNTPSIVIWKVTGAFSWSNDIHTDWYRP